MVLLAAAILVYALALSGGYYFDHDEHHYISASILARELRLYSDFIYTQPPLYPIIVGFLADLFAFDSVADFRVVNPVLISAVFVALTFYCRVIGLGYLEALSLATIFVFSDINTKSIGLTRNDILPLLFFTAGAAVFALGLRKTGPRPYLLFLSGLLFALATSVKVTYLFGPVGAGLALLIGGASGAGWGRTARDVGLLAAGGILASVPMLGMLWQDWDRVFFSIYTFHKEITVAWLNQDGVNLGTRLDVRIINLVKHFGYGASILFVGLIVWSVIALIRSDGVSGFVRGFFNARSFLTVFWVLASFFLMMMTLQMATTYVVPFLASLVLFAATLFCRLPDEQRAIGRGLLAGFAVLSVGTAVALSAPTIYQGFRGGLTAVEQQDVEAAILRQTVPDYCGRRVATLTPTAPLLAGLEIYPELAIGVFFFRGGDIYAPERIRQLNGATPRTLPALLTARPPAAIYAGSYQNRRAVDGTVMNQPFVDFAEQHGYIKNPGGKKGIFDIYVRPGAAGCEDADRAG